MKQKEKGFTQTEPENQNSKIKKLMLWKPIDLFKTKFVLFAHEDLGGGEGGQVDKYFFSTNIRGKEETPFGTQFKKKIFFIIQSKIGEK